MQPNLDDIGGARELAFHRIGVTYGRAGCAQTDTPVEIV